MPWTVSLAKEYTLIGRVEILVLYRKSTGEISEFVLRVHRGIPVKTSLGPTRRGLADCKGASQG